MNKLINKRNLIGVGILAVGFLLGWIISPSNKSTEPDHVHQTESIAQIWTCSMHPQIRQSEPGKCPICGMDLIPLQSDGSSVDPLAISMSPTAMMLADVTTQVVGGGAPVKTIHLNGKIQADERLIYSQSSHIPGRVERLEINFTGEYVKRGQTIAYVYSPELVTAQKELIEAKKIADTQPQLFQAAKEKLKNWKLTDAQINQITSSGNIVEQFPILAEASGYVINKKTNLGDYLSKGSVIYEIVDLSKVWALFDVYEADMVWIKRGDQVKFTISSLPGKDFKGNISFIDPAIDPKSRVAKARVELINRENLLKPEMFISGTVQAKQQKLSNTIAVPKSAVMWTGKRSVIYIKSTTDQGVQFLMREVELGATLGDSYIIVNGLEAGEEIAVNGTFSIDAAAQLAGKPSMMSPAGGTSMNGHNHDENKPSDLNVSPTPISKQAKAALQPLYDGYFKLENALVVDDQDLAKKSTENIKTILSKIDMALFTGESHAIWMQHSSTLSNILQHAGDMGGIAELRKTFQSISNTMIILTKSFDPLPEAIYVQHCPMADQNKGADWLSKIKEIRNPYFGQAMLTCGEITSVIE